MTGPTTSLGRTLAEHAATGFGAGFFAWIIFSFWLGAVCSAVMIDHAHRKQTSRYAAPIAVEAMLLTVFSICIDVHLGRGILPQGIVLFALSGLACFAMGLQNATISRISGAVVRTTHVTGVVTDLGTETVQYCSWLLRGKRGDHAAGARVVVLASIFGSFLFGVVAATVVFRFLPRVAMLLPAGFLTILVVPILWRARGEVCAGAIQRVS